MASTKCPDCGTPYAVGDTCFSEECKEFEDAYDIEIADSLEDAISLWGSPDPNGKDCDHSRQYEWQDALWCFDCGDALSAILKDMFT